MPVDSLSTSPEVTAMVASLSAEKATAALWFSSSLAEEVGKTDANNIKQYDDLGPHCYISD